MSKQAPIAVQHIARTIAALASIFGPILLVIALAHLLTH